MGALTGAGEIEPRATWFPGRPADDAAVYECRAGLGHGLHLSFNWGGDWNTFGRNTARGNPGGPCAFAGGPYPPTADFCDEGLANSSFNDNYMPNFF